MKCHFLFLIPMHIKVIRLLAKNLAIPGNIGLTGLEHLCHWGRFDILSLAEPWGWWLPWGWWSPWAVAVTACSSVLQPQPVCHVLTAALGAGNRSCSPLELPLVFLWRCAAGLGGGHGVQNIKLVSPSCWSSGETRSRVQTICPSSELPTCEHRLKLAGSPTPRW